MADRKFDTDAERAAYDAGREDKAKEQKPPLTMADVRTMSPAEIAERKKDVHDAIRRHEEGTDDDGGDDDESAS